MRHLGVVVLATFILLPLVQAILLSFTATLPQDGSAQGAIGLMNYRSVLATTVSRALMEATSSTCSLMNHCMNCSPA